MKNIIIESYIKKNDEYINILDFKGDIPNPDYIDGALILKINGISLIDKTMNDYIDDLWCYFSEGLSLVHEEKKFSCFFPDQPIEVKFIPLGNKVQIVVNCHDEVKVNVDKNDFLLSMSEHARAFFHRLMEIEPSSKESITYAISYLDKIKF